MNKTYYAIDINCPDMEPGFAMLYVTPATYWEERHCMADWTEQDTLKEITNAGFTAGVAEDSCVEILMAQLEEIQMFLLMHPDFEINQAFNDFVLDSYK